MSKLLSLIVAATFAVVAVPSYAMKHAGAMDKKDDAKVEKKEAKKKAPKKAAKKAEEKK
jgi:hypothetical protein